VEFLQYLKLYITLLYENHLITQKCKQEGIRDGKIILITHENFDLCKVNFHQLCQRWHEQTFLSVRSLFQKSYYITWWPSFLIAICTS